MQIIYLVKEKYQNPLKYQFSDYSMASFILKYFEDKMKNKSYI